MSIDSNIELFLSNRDFFQKAWRLGSNLDASLAALLCTSRNVLATQDNLVQCESLLKSKLSMFSHFRGFSQSAVISILMGQDDPEALLDKAIDIYKDLSKQFLIDDYLPIGAMIIAIMNQPERNAEIIERSRAIYKTFRTKHPLITDSQDSILCILLGCTKYDVNQIVEHTEECMRLLKKGFFSADHYQSLGMILALYPESPQEKAEKVKALLDEFQKQKIMWGRNYELALTGSLAMSGQPPEILVQKVQYADNILNKSTGFQLIDTSGSYRTVLAASLVLDAISENREADYFVVGSLIGMLITEYIIIMMTVNMQM
jgi:hypothetical protein